MLVKHLNLDNDTLLELSNLLKEDYEQVSNNDLINELKNTVTTEFIIEKLIETLNER